MRVEPQSRRSLDLAFGMLLASGVCVGGVGLLGIRDWIWPQGEGAFALYIYGQLSFIPTILAWLASGVISLLGSRDRDLRLAAMLTTGHLGWWLVFIGLLMWIHRSPPAVIFASVSLEPILYGSAASYLAVRWFRRRSLYSKQVAASP